jgi:NADPH:quinone reductase-like Zn-dependent oxidoreductase
MKTLVLKAIHEPLELVERAGLQARPGEVVVQLKAAALNRRDYWITQGKYPGIRLPIVLGSDGAGVVAECGEGVDAGWLGREVIMNPGLDWGGGQSVQSSSFTILGLPRDGTFATEIAIPAAQLYARPAPLSWEEASALPLAGVTAYRALFSQGGLQRGETLLITGIGGGVATFALQFAVAIGAQVWVTSSSQSKIQRAAALGARGGFNYTSDSWAKECAEAAGPPHLILDSAAGSGYASLVDLAAPGGRIVNYGATAGPPKTLDLFKVFWKQLRLQGSTMGSPADFAAMLALVERYGIKPVIDTTFPLADGNRALAQMERSPQFGKYVLTTS